MVLFLLIPSTIKKTFHILGNLHIMLFLEAQLLLTHTQTTERLSLSAISPLLVDRFGRFVTVLQPRYYLGAIFYV